MPRPSGTPFWGESLPPEDWAVLTGSADFAQFDGVIFTADSGAPGAAQEWGEGEGLSGDSYVQVPSAAKLLWIFDSTTSYLESGDTVEVSWLVRARGTGTIDITNDRDTSWAHTAPGGASIGSAAVSSGSWAEYEFATIEYTVTDILDGSGGYRLAVDVVGAVDIDVVQMRIWPPGGALGGYASHGPEDVQINLKTRRMEISDSAEESALADTASSPDLEVDSATAHGTMLAQASGAMSERDDQELTTGRGAVHNSARDDVLSNLAGTVHLYKWHYDTAYLLCEVPGLNVTIPGGYQAGTEGVDYIRRPDRTYRDMRDFWDWPDADRPEVTGWVNNVGHLEGEKYVNSAPPWDWADTDPVVVSIYFDDWVGATPTLLAWRPASYTMPPSVSGDLYELPDTGSIDEYIDLNLPVQDRFAIFMGNSMVFTSPPERDLTGQTFAGQASISATATLNLGGPATGDRVKAVVTIPNYRYWTPDGSPTVSWVRNIQRNDGLGVSPWRWGSNVKVNVRVVGVTFSGFGSNQSIRWRGTR